MNIHKKDGTQEIESKEYLMPEEAEELVFILSDMILEIVAMGEPELIKVTERILKIFHREAISPKRA